MGDLVRSEAASSVPSLHSLFNHAISRTNAVRRGSLLSPLTITLGDEFQGLAPSLVDAMSIVRDIRLMLLDDDIECRFVIGWVTLETPLNTANAWNMMGPGLARAREKLNQKRASTLYRFSVDNDRDETVLEALGAGLTAIEQRWTSQQQEDILALLAGATPNDIARQRNVTVHNIYKVRSAGDFDTYLIQWDAINALLKALDQAPVTS